MKVSSEVKLFGCIIVIAVILVFFAIAPIIFEKPHPQVPAPVKLTRDMLVPANPHLKGDPKAPITLVVFSDFECPMCRTAAMEMDTIMTRRNGQMNMIYRHFKAQPRHRYTEDFAVAAEAADKQGKFWEMHDAIFHDQKSLIAKDSKEVAAALKELAGRFHLDVAKFEADMNKDDGPKRYADDLQAANTAQVRSTPTFFFIPAHGDVVELFDLEMAKTWCNDDKHFK